MRLLNGRGGALDTDALCHLYAEQPWHQGATGRNGGAYVKLNMVSTVDGSGTGADARSGSINTAADHEVFAALRAWCDVVLIGAGTASAEGYRALSTDRDHLKYRAGRDPHPHLAVLTARPLPKTLLDSQSDDTGTVSAVTARHGLDGLVADLAGRGMPRVLCEGGPHLAASMIASAVIDELCLTTSPMVVAGDGTRILAGDFHQSELELLSLVEQSSSLMARWRVLRPS